MDARLQGRHHLARQRSVASISKYNWWNLNTLGRIPTQSGDTVDIGDWSAAVLGVEHRAITRVALRPRHPHNTDPAATTT